MLLEGNILFDVIDMEYDFMNYQVLILLDYVVVNDELKGKLDLFLQQGGKVFVIGWLGLDQDGMFFVIDFGVRYVGVNLYCLDFFYLLFKFVSLGEVFFVMYMEGQKFEFVGGMELGSRKDLYFNCDVFIFCLYQYMLSSDVYGGLGMVESVGGIYLVWNVFEDYVNQGSLILKEMILYVLNCLLFNKILNIDLFVQGVIILQN